MTFLCTCNHCRATVAFDPKQNGDTIACPACNQDLKLYKRSATPDPTPKAAVNVSTVVHKINETGETECCHCLIFKLPKEDRFSFDDAEVTCEGCDPAPAPAPAPVLTERTDCPPVMALVQREKAKRNVLFGALVALGALGAICVIMIMISGGCRYYTHDSLQSAAGQEYGVRDHITGHKSSPEQVEHLALQIGINGAGVAEFVRGYFIGWNLIDGGQPLPVPRYHVSQVDLQRRAYLHGTNYDALHRGKFNP